MVIVTITGACSLAEAHCQDSTSAVAYCQGSNAAVDVRLQRRANLDALAALGDGPCLRRTDLTEAPLLAWQVLRCAGAPALPRSVTDVERVVGPLVCHRAGCVGEHVRIQLHVLHTCRGNGSAVGWMRCRH